MANGWWWINKYDDRGKCYYYEDSSGKWEKFTLVDQEEWKTTQYEDNEGNYWHIGMSPENPYSFKHRTI